jgi:DNA repair exonuclease SbcCD ATPase subunit
MRTVKIEGLTLRNFKVHQDITFTFSGRIVIKGHNGEGKSTIGEGVPWTMWGCDLFGSNMVKNLDPAPTTYPFDPNTQAIEGSLLLNVDGTIIKLTRKIKKGTTTLFINDVKKSATIFNNFVSEIFSKELFLSIFSPGFFFSQNWSVQRDQIMKYVKSPLQAEVLDALPELERDVLEPLLKKNKLEEVEDTHKDRKKEYSELLIDRRATLRTLREQQIEPGEEVRAASEWAKMIEGTELEIKQAEEHRKAYNEKKARKEQLKREYQAAYDSAKSVEAKANELKEHVHSDTCITCNQTLPDDLIQTMQQKKDDQLEVHRAEYKAHQQKWKLLKAEFEGISLGEEPLDINDMHNELNNFKWMHKKALVAEGLQAKIEGAGKAVTDAEKELKNSTFIVDSIKSYRTKNAELVLSKMDSLFPTLTISHNQANVTNGEKKEFFELCQTGKPYRKLSVGERVGAWLELAEVLATNSNLHIPLFVDNAESYTGEIETKLQTFECYAEKGKVLEFA